MISSQRALVIGSSSLNINPTNALTIGSLYDVSASEAENPNLQLIHSRRS